MNKFARIENSTAVEVFTPPVGVDIADCFHAEIAGLFTPCPDNVTVGSTIDSSGKWTIAPSPAPAVAPAPILPMLTPMTLYLAFTPAERIAIKKSVDPMVIEFWATYQLSVQLDKPTDPNLMSVQEAIGYLAQPTTATPPGAGILASQARIAQVLAGTPQ